MLNPFPIQFLAPLAYFLIRVTLGFVCLRTGALLFRTEEASAKRKILGAILTSAGIALIFGIFTQYAALTTFFTLTLTCIRKTSLPHLTRTTLVLMIIMALSLFITGAGPFAFDLPL